MTKPDSNPTSLRRLMMAPIRHLEDEEETGGHGETRGTPSRISLPLSLPPKFFLRPLDLAAAVRESKGDLAGEAIVQLFVPGYVPIVVRQLRKKLKPEYSPGGGKEPPKGALLAAVIRWGLRRLEAEECVQRYTQLCTEVDLEEGLSERAQVNLHHYLHASRFQIESGGDLGRGGKLAFRAHQSVVDDLGTTAEELGLSLSGLGMVALAGGLHGQKGLGSWGERLEKIYERLVEEIGGREEHGRKLLDAYKGGEKVAWDGVIGWGGDNEDEKEEW